MAEPALGQTPPVPAAAPPAAAGAMPPRPGFGTTPATQPVANAGQDTAGLHLLAVIQGQMLMALAHLGPSSEAGTDTRRALDLISKHVPPGAVTPAAMLNTMKAMMLKLQQQAPQIAQMRQMAAQQTAGAQPAMTAPPEQAAA